MNTFLGHYSDRDWIKNHKKDWLEATLKEMLETAKIPLSVKRAKKRIYQFIWRELRDRKVFTFNPLQEKKEMVNEKPLEG